MRGSWRLALVLLAGMSACASSGDMDDRLRLLREEIMSDIRAKAGELRDSYKKDLKASENDMKKEIAELRTSFRQETNELAAMQKKYSLETDKTFIDHQKQIFQLKTLSDDTARRVYMLETILTSRNIAGSQQTDRKSVV